MGYTFEMGYSGVHFWNGLQRGTLLKWDTMRYTEEHFETLEQLSTAAAEAATVRVTEAVTTVASFTEAETAVAPVTEAEATVAPVTEMQKEQR